MARIDASRIPVYPHFTFIKRTFNLLDNPWICEDDHGRIAFVSEKAKAQYIKWSQTSTGRRP